jgi:hypothetical protein
MANTLTGLIPTLYESLDVIARELIGAIPAVTRDSQVARAAKGQTVSSFVAPAVTASDITPGVTAPNDGDQVLTNIPITITKSRYVPIRVSPAPLPSAPSRTSLTPRLRFRSSTTTALRSRTASSSWDRRRWPTFAASRACCSR